VFLCAAYGVTNDDGGGDDDDDANDLGVPLWELVKATFMSHLYCRRRRLRPVLTLVASAL